MVRVHSECITGDVFGSQRCDCGPQLNTAMKMIAKEGKGAILYMSQEGRGIGIANKLKAYKLQEDGADTVEATHKLGFDADLRMGWRSDDAGFKLNQPSIGDQQPKKIIGLKGYGLDVIERIPIEITAGKHNKNYLSTKASKLGHMLKNNGK